MPVSTAAPGRRRSSDGNPSAHAAATTAAPTGDSSASVDSEGGAGGGLPASSADSEDDAEERDQLSALVQSGLVALDVCVVLAEAAVAMGTLTFGIYGTYQQSTWVAVPYLVVQAAMVVFLVAHAATRQRAMNGVLLQLWLAMEALHRRTPVTVPPTTGSGWWVNGRSDEPHRHLAVSAVLDKPQQQPPLAVPAGPRHRTGGLPSVLVAPSRGGDETSLTFRSPQPDSRNAAAAVAPSPRSPRSGTNATDDGEEPAAAADAASSRPPPPPEPTAAQRAIARAYAIARASIAATASTLSTLPVGPDDELPPEQDELDEENALRLRALIRRSARTVHQRLAAAFLGFVMLVGGCLAALVCVPGYLHYAALGSSGVLALTVGSLLTQWHLGALLLWTVFGEPAALMRATEAMAGEYLRQLRCWRTLHNAGGALDVHWALSAHTQLRAALRALSALPAYAMLATTAFALLWVALGGALIMYLNPPPPARYNWAWLVAAVCCAAAAAAALAPFWSLAHLADDGAGRAIREMRADAALAYMEAPLAAAAAAAAALRDGGNGGSSAAAANAALLPAVDYRRHMAHIESFEMYLAVNDTALRVFGLRLSRPAIAGAVGALALAVLFLLRDSLIASGALHTWE